VLLAMVTALRGTEVAIERIDVSIHTIPTDLPESDGTMRWDSTTPSSAWLRRGITCAST